MVVGSGHPGLASQRLESLEKTLAARTGPDGLRPHPTIAQVQPQTQLLTASAWARMSPINKAFCSPVEHCEAAMFLGPWITLRSLRWGPRKVRPASLSARRESVSSLRYSSSARTAGIVPHQGLNLALDGNQAPWGKAVSLRCPWMCLCRASMAEMRAAAMAMAASAIWASRLASQVVGLRFLQQQIALAHDFFEDRDPRGMFRDRSWQPACP